MADDEEKEMGRRGGRSIEKQFQLEWKVCQRGEERKEGRRSVVRHSRL